jgi:hypothetical protein
MGGMLMLTPNKMQFGTLRSTDATMPLSGSFWRIIGIFRCKFVPIFTMGALIILVSHSAKGIDSVGHKFHVHWIDAVSHSAQMINFEIWRNRGNQDFEAESVRTPCFAFKSDCSIARTVAAGDPQPTAGVPIDSNFRLQAIRKIAKAEVSHNSPHDIGNGIMGAIYLER